jgi:hypothetical protein
VRGTRGSMIRPGGPTVLAIGVTDLIVVATADAVLVTSRGTRQQLEGPSAWNSGRSRAAGRLATPKSPMAGSRSAPCSLLPSKSNGPS